MRGEEGVTGGLGGVRRRWEGRGGDGRGGAADGRGAAGALGATARVPRLGCSRGSIGVGWRGQYGGWAVGWAQSCLPWRAGAHQPFQTPYCVCKISCGKSSYRRKKPIDPMATPQRAACVKWGGVRRVA